MFDNKDNINPKTFIHSKFPLDSSSKSERISPLPTTITTTDFSIKNLATSSRKEENVSFEDDKRISHINIPLNVKKEEEDEGDICSPQNKKKKKKMDKNVSSEEMEQRNEIFRSTYYNQQQQQQQNSSRKDCQTSLKSSYRYTDRPLLHLNKSKHSHYPTTHSPPSLQPISHHSVRYERYNTYVNDTKCKHSITDRLFRRQTHHSSNEYFLNTSPSLIDRSPDRHVTTVDPFMSSSGLQFTHKTRDRYRKDWSSQSHPYPMVSGMARKSMTTSTRLEQHEAEKYNSDFFTKLPPKLHIVESQNENGVTLTWNATSNCDSSLVKSYQLFARELFGHKVGTMKRIGIVDALPLPMSCNIDKLRYHIKYKFAVCAIDVYGRYGKMSNFTGKFELKPKSGDLEDLPSMELSKHQEESQLEISL